MDFLEERKQNDGICLGMDTMRALMEQLGNPQDILCFVHIAGTNGKGSVLAYIAQILQCAGYRVGAYSSPAVFGKWETIAVNGEPIREQTADEGLRILRDAEERMLAAGAKRRATAFEMETALALWYFAKRQCDIVVMEAGLGGDADATNVIDTTVCAVMTPIALDHTAMLGNTLEQIAAHKAGILKKGVPLVTTKRQPDEVMEVLKARCHALGCGLFTETEASGTTGLHERAPENVFPYPLTMCAAYQKQNAELALAVIRILAKNNLKITEEAIRRGFFTAVWHGRFEQLASAPDIYIDGAHNPAAAAALADCIREVFGPRKPVLIMGVLRDKDYQGMLEIMLPLAESLYTVTPDNPRALSAAELAEAARSRSEIPVTACERIETAAAQAIQEAGTEGGVVCFGSLSYLDAVKKAVEALLGENR